MNKVIRVTEISIEKAKALEAAGYRIMIVNKTK